MSESKQELETWAYLRAAYYPRFVEGITQLPWYLRFDVLAEIYGSWEPRAEDPVETMMEYIFDKGYFKFFVKGVEVFEDGSFKLHKLISANLGSVGIYDDGF